MAPFQRGAGGGEVFDDGVDAGLRHDLEAFERLALHRVAVKQQRAGSGQ